MTRSFVTPPYDPDTQAINHTETASALDAGVLIAEPTKVTLEDDTAALVFMGADGQPKTVDLIGVLAGHRPWPSRKAGSFRVHDAESFVGYMAKHFNPHSEVWADALSQQIVGVLNAHGGAVATDYSEAAGWGDHRVTYGVQKTVAWKAWLDRDGKLMSQTEFAELIEDRLVDIVRPDAADLLELAQSFEATIGVRFESSRLLSSGERQLSYRESVDAKAGQAGQLAIPKDFELAIQPFEGADVFGLVARFRYRITDGTLRIGYKLTRPEDVLRDAFESVVTNVQAGVSVPVYRGVSG